MGHIRRQTGMRAFSQEEVEKISAWCATRRHEKRDRLLLLLLCFCALRCQEALNLTIGQVWQDGQVVDDLELLADQSKGGYGGRIIPLHRRVKWAIIDYLQTLPFIDPSLPLIQSQKNDALDRRSAWRIIKSAARALDLKGKIGTHSGRKYKGTTVWNNTHDAAQVQEVLGHNSLQYTRIYINIADEVYRRAFVDD